MTSQYLYEDLTGLIWKAYSPLFEEMKARPGLTQFQLANAVFDRFRDFDICASRDVPVIVRHDSAIGYGRFDIVVDCRVAVAVTQDCPTPHNYVERFKRHMEGMGLPVGAILNFAAENARDGYKRIYLPECDYTKLQRKNR